MTIIWRIKDCFPLNKRKFEKSRDVFHWSFPGSFHIILAREVDAFQYLPSYLSSENKEEEKRLCVVTLRGRNDGAICGRVASYRGDYVTVLGIVVRFAWTWQSYLKLMLRPSERTLIPSSSQSIGFRLQSLHRRLRFAQPGQELVQRPVEVVERVHRGVQQFPSIDDATSGSVDTVLLRDLQSDSAASSFNLRHPTDT